MKNSTESVLELKFHKNHALMMILTIISFIELSIGNDIYPDTQVQNCSKKFSI